jgi:hypothetical protein
LLNSHFYSFVKLKACTALHGGQAEETNRRSQVSCGSERAAFYATARKLTRLFHEKRDFLAFFVYFCGKTA